MFFWDALGWFLFVAFVWSFITGKPVIIIGGDEPEPKKPVEKYLLEDVAVRMKHRRNRLPNNGY